MKSGIKRKESRKKSIIISLTTLLLISTLILGLTGCVDQGRVNKFNISNNKNKTADFVKGEVNLYLFWQVGCPHCAAEEEFLMELLKKYPMNIYKFEIRNSNENRSLWFEMCKVYGEKPIGTPTLFIGEKSFVGFSKANDLYAKEIESQIKNCVEKGCYDKGSYLRKELNIKPTYSSVEKEEKNEEVFSIGEEEESGSCEGEDICAPEESEGKEGVGDNKETDENLLNNKTLIIPVLGKVRVDKISLPLLTVVIAGLDGFNPCAMWVLSFLLTLLIYSRSRKKMLIIGLTFVITSGVIYFLFMTAWLNLFLLIGYVNLLRILIGFVALFMGVVNVKDAFWFKKGISLTIPDSVKPKLFKRMRTVIKEAKESEGMPLTAIIGTIILAVTANLIELACTAGFPAIYTRILTLKQLPIIQYYLYLVLYNMIYVIPLLIIVIVFALTLGAHKFGEKQGRVLKFIGGVLMLVLGFLLIYKPEVLMFG